MILTIHKATLVNHKQGDRIKLFHALLVKLNGTKMLILSVI